MKAKKTTLTVFCPLYPPSIGGLQNHAEQWNQEMTKLGYKVVLFTPAHPLATTERNIVRFPAFELIPNYPVPKFWHISFWQSLSKLPIENSIVISRTRFFSTSLIALLFTKFTGQKLLHIEHGSDYIHLKNPIYTTLAKLYDHTLGRLIFNQADRVVTVSNAAKQFVKKFTNRQDIHVIYRGIDHNLLKNTPPDQILQSKLANKTIIAYSGRLIDGKGVDDLLRAYAKVANDHNHLVVIGSGPQEKKLKQQVKKRDLNHQISFLGKQTQSRAINILNIAHLVINPSYTEGLPSSIIESALLKKAIIATDVGGTPEIITDKESGILIKPKDIEQLTQALQTLLQNPAERKKLGENAYQINRNKFNWQTAAEKYSKIIESL